MVPAGYVLVPAETFTMGSPSNELGRASDEAQHAVTITRSFYLKATEVTQAQWRAVAQSSVASSPRAPPWSRPSPSYFPSCGDECPVEWVNWYEAVAYVNALSVLEGLPECYTLTGCNGNDPGSDMECTGVVFVGLGCTGYRLPTEAEWEYAARAGTTTAFWNGGITTTGCPEPSLDAVGWYGGNSMVAYSGAYSGSLCAGSGTYGTHPVAQKPANAWGLYDVHGNVWEWAHDWYGSYPAGASTDPAGPGTGSTRVRRGGSWSNDALICRSANRNRNTPGYRYNDLGLRPARSSP